MHIPWGGTRVSVVSDELSAAFEPGDALIVVQDTGELLYHSSNDEAAIACAREIGAWKDVEHERAVILTKDLVVVIDRLLADEPHTYDPNVMI